MRVTQLIKVIPMADMEELIGNPYSPTSSTRYDMMEDPDEEIVVIWDKNNGDTFIESDNYEQPEQ